MRVAENAAELAESFGLIVCPAERLEEVMRWARRLEPYPDEERCSARLVPGCVSRVWLCLRLENGGCRFLVDADSPMVRGLAGLVVRLYGCVSPEDAAGCELRLSRLLGLDRILSPTRLQGLDRIQAAARNLAGAMTSAPFESHDAVDRLS